MSVVAFLLAGMLAVFSAIGQEEAAGCPGWEERWEPIERAGWVLLGVLVLAGGVV